MSFFLSQASKRIQTTMIGALSKMENNFGYLWGHFKKGELNDRELEFADLWDSTRNAILDQGNQQIRGLQQDYNMYGHIADAPIPLTMKTVVKENYKLN